MLPDFPKVKQFAQRAVLRAVALEIPRLEPMLAGIRHTTIHEGMSGHLTRSDSTTDEIKLRPAHAEISIPKAKMKRITFEELRELLVQMAEQIAEQQAKAFIEKIGRTVDETGNSFSVAQLGHKQAFLEMERGIEADFDPVTLEPQGHVLLVHPNQLAQIAKFAEESASDAEFQQELKLIRQQKLEEWRAREDRRKLVD